MYTIVYVLINCCLYAIMFKKIMFFILRILISRIAIYIYIAGWIVHELSIIYIHLHATEY